MTRNERKILAVAKHPKVQLLDPERDLFIVTEDFEITIRVGDQEIPITIPTGFTTNLGSVPSWLWWWRAPWDYLTAVVAHDYLYSEGFTRGVADEALKALIPGKVDKWIYWLAVRLCGWWAYERHRA